MLGYKAIRLNGFVDPRPWREGLRDYLQRTELGGGANRGSNASVPAQLPTEGVTQAQEEVSTEARDAVKPVNAKIVALGDSFTYGNPVGPEKSWTKWAADNLGVAVVNKGRVGQTSKDVLARFDLDVLAENPGRVIIFVGDGDATRGVSDLEYQRSIKAMVEKARESQITPILAFPVPYRGLEQRIKGMRDWLKGYAETEKIQSIDFAAVLFDSQGKYLKGMSRDGKYPTLEGYRAMGQYAAQVLGAR